MRMRRAGLGFPATPYSPAIAKGAYSSSVSRRRRRISFHHLLIPQSFMHSPVYW